ncbi:MAG: ABC transporter ATP-binding protein [Dongiaceae bacterium]
MIEVTGLIFDYPGLRALDDVSFDIERGTVTGLVGPNGAGKTTLLNCMAALDRPAAGAVRIAGLDVHDDPREAHRQLGFLSDFYGLYDQLTVRQCLIYRAGAQGVAPAQRDGLAASAAERFGLADRMGQTAGTLSRGLRQRLAIAQASLHDPAVLLLDEPASGLDPEARIALAGVLRGLRDGGMTIVVSSHILAELEDYSTHIMVMREGRVIEHRALAGSGQTGRRVVRVSLARPDARLLDILRADPLVADIADEGQGLRFAYAGDDDHAQALLHQLVAAGLPVTGFGADRGGMQDAYLATLAKAGRA